MAPPPKAGPATCYEWETTGLFRHNVDKLIEARRGMVGFKTDHGMKIQRHLYLANMAVPFNLKPSASDALEAAIMEQEKGNYANFKSHHTFLLVSLNSPISTIYKPAIHILQKFEKDYPLITQYLYRQESVRLWKADREEARELEMEVDVIDGQRRGGEWFAMKGIWVYDWKDPEACVLLAARVLDEADKFAKPPTNKEAKPKPKGQKWKPALKRGKLQYKRNRGKRD